jgi:hypothetical protein
MAEQILHRADVVANLEHVRRKAVSERVAARRLRERGCAHPAFDRALYCRLVQAVTALAGVVAGATAAGRREDPLPAPLARRPRILARKGFGQRDRAEAEREVRIVRAARTFHLRRQRHPERARKHGHAVLASLAVAHGDLTA